MSMIFDFNTIEDFDNHINLSIPNYNQLLSLFIELTTILSGPNTTVLDYGCSTGKLLKALPKKVSCKYIGIDNSDLIPEDDSTVEFVKTDATTYVYPVKPPPSVIISMFFLQFLHKNQRQSMYKLFKEQVQNGSTLLISEKIILDDPQIENLISRLHIHTKRANFTATEVLDKDRQLLHSMFCKTEVELMEELSELGRVTKVWQSFNFVGFVVRSF